MPRPVKTDTPVSLDKQMQAAKGSFPLDAVVEINVAALVGSAVAAAALPPVLTGIGVPPIERIVTSTDPSGKKKLTSLLEEDFGSLGILHKGWRRKVQAACKDATKKSVKTDE